MSKTLSINGMMQMNENVKTVANIRENISPRFFFLETGGKDYATGNPSIGITNEITERHQKS